MNYFDQLQKYHKQHGHTTLRMPYLDKRPVDLYQLKKEVEARDGYESVCDKKRWAEIGRDMGYGNSRMVTSISTSLKALYSRYIAPYEEYVLTAKPEVLASTTSPSLKSGAASFSPARTPDNKSFLARASEVDSGDEYVDELMDAIVHEVADEIDGETAYKSSKRRKKLDGSAAPIVRGSNMALHETGLRHTHQDIEEQHKRSRHPEVSLYFYKL